MEKEFLRLSFPLNYLYIFFLIDYEEKIKLNYGMKRKEIYSIYKYKNILHNIG